MIAKANGIPKIHLSRFISKDKILPITFRMSMEKAIFEKDSGLYTGLIGIKLCGTTIYWRPLAIRRW